MQLKTKDGTALVRQDMASGALDHSRTWTVNVTGTVKTYVNPPGTLASVADINAL